MRRLAFLLLPFLPLAAAAQSTPPKPASEVAFNLGHAFDNAREGFSHGGFLRGSLSLLRSKGHFLYGLTAEGGTNSDDFWYIAPGIVANYRSSSGRGYWYGGAMAGYNLYGNMLGYDAADLRHGYVFGLQAGIVRPLSRRLSLNAELAVRSSQYWTQYTGNYWMSADHNATSGIVVYMPATIGIRYALH